MQKRRHSFLESLTNIAVGYGVALTSQMVIFPIFDIHIKAREHMMIGVFFTVVSLVRSYALRRVFNRWTEADKPSR